MTLAHDRHLQTGIAGSLLVHALLLMLLAWGLGSQAARQLLEEPAEARAEEREVALIFPEQVVEPPPPVSRPQLFIRTTQNEESGVIPRNAAFQSDRNTVAASRKAPVPGATLPMPTLDGSAPDVRELANRDYRDGQIRQDSAAGATPPRPEQPERQAAPSPAPVVKAVPVAVARPSAPPTPEKRDLNAARLDLAEPAPADTPPAPKMRSDEPPVPQVRVPEEAPPPMAPTATGLPAQSAPNPAPDAFTPFTRTSRTDGAMTNPGQDAVDAEATPLGIYMRQVTGAVEKKWHLYVRLAKDSVSFGRVRFRFFVDRRGTPQDLTILSDARDADPRMRELTLRAILDAQIPPIPAALLPTLDDGRVKIEYEAIVY